MTTVHPTMFVATDLNGLTSLFTPRNKRGALVHSHTGNVVSIENVPVSGFRIVVSDEDFNVTKRQPTVNIFDPRGFIVRCNTTNIFQMMMESTVVDGVIVDECVWAVRNGVSLLMKHNSNMLTTALMPKVYIKQEDVPFGSIVTLKNGTELQYVGYHGFYVDNNTDVTPLYNLHAYYELDGKEFNPKHVSASNKFHILRYRSPVKLPDKLQTTKGTYFKLDGQERFYNVVSHSPNYLIRSRYVTKPLSEFKMSEHRKVQIKDNTGKIAFVIIPNKRETQYITAYPCEYNETNMHKIFNWVFNANETYRSSLKMLSENSTFTYIEHFLEDEKGKEIII